MFDTAWQKDKSASVDIPVLTATSKSAVFLNDIKKRRRLSDENDRVVLHPGW